MFLNGKVRWEAAGGWAVLPALAVLLGACGGSGSSGPTSTAQASTEAAGVTGSDGSSGSSDSSSGSSSSDSGGSGGNASPSDGSTGDSGGSTGNSGDSAGDSGGSAGDSGGSAGAPGSSSTSLDSGGTSGEPYAGCLNGVRDGDETDIDCGGATCRRCEDGQACGADADCVNLSCPAGLCGEDAPAGGAVGTRCHSAGDCALGLECYSSFWGERPICTQACADAECPTGSVCVDEIPNYLDDVVGPYCLRPCELSADCEDEFGSECDTVPEVDGRYCY